MKYLDASSGCPLPNSIPPKAGARTLCDEPPVPCRSKDHVAVGRALTPLRDEGVPIIGSGLSYHNLRKFGPKAKEPSALFDRWLQETLVEVSPAERVSPLLDWEAAPAERRAHPQEDHLLPLMVAVGAAGDERNGMGFMPFWPLNGGALAQSSAMADTAARSQATTAQVSLAWLIKKSENIILIPGTSSIEHLEDNVGAPDIHLSDEDMATLSVGGATGLSL